MFSMFRGDMLKPTGDGTAELSLAVSEPFPVVTFDVVEVLAAELRINCKSITSYSGQILQYNCVELKLSDKN